MHTGGAQFRCLDTNDNVTAVTALPNLDFTLLKDLSGFYILQQCTLTLLVVLLNSGNQTELCSQLLEALSFGGLCESGIHVGPLVVFALCSIQQVLGGTGNTVMQFLEPHLCMLLLVISSFQEQGSNLLKSTLLSLGCIVSIFISCHGFARKGSFQILFGLSTGVLISYCLLSKLKAAAFLLRQIKRYYGIK